MIKRIVCILLLLSMLSVTFIGCSKKDKEEDQNSVSTSDVKEDDEISDGLPDNLNYGKTICVLATESQMNKTFVTDLTGTAMNDALYIRLKATETRLGVTFEFIPCAHAWEDASNYTDMVRNDILANAVSEYDLFMSYNLLPSLMITNGYLSDLTQSLYLDTKKPWWPQNMLEEATIDNKLYYVVDNCSWGSIRNMACIVFNKDLAKTYSINEADLYNEVFEHNWTIETMEKYITNVYSDVGGNGERDEKDIYGLACDGAPRLDAFFYGSGLRTTDRDSEGNLVLTLNDAKIVDVVERYKKLLHSNTSVYSKPDPAIDSMFKNKTVLFYETAIAIADQQLEFDYGVLPIPMWDTDQEEYITYLSNTHDAWSVPINTSDIDMAGALLTSLACEAYRTVMPQYFEEMLKLRYSSDVESARVYDIIRDGVVFDFGYMFGMSFTGGYAPFFPFRHCLINKDQSWTSTLETYEDRFNEDITTILTSIRDNNK